MTSKSEARRFTELFITFILIELVLYTIIVYFDIFGIKTEYINSNKIRKDPAFMLFYGISAIVFGVFLVRLNRSQ